MAAFNSPTYEIAKPTGTCALSGQSLKPGDPYVATLIECDPNDPASSASRSGALGLLRMDVAWSVWQSGQRPARVFSHWKSTVPEPNQKKKIFVDDDVLLQLFERLAEDPQPQRQAFRFVLALILMRKKILKYEGMNEPSATHEPERSQEWWKMSARGSGQIHEVLNPQLDETQIQQVSEQLSEVLDAQW